MSLNYKLFQTREHNYVYDANCDKFVKITQSLYYAIRNKIQGYQQSQEYMSLMTKGFFKENKLQLAQNPATEMMPYYIDRQMQSMTLQVTQGCNLRCQYCPYSQENDLIRSHSEKAMSWETARVALDILFSHSVDAGFSAISFYGGEPLLNFGLIKKAVLYAEEQLYGRDFNFNITTNATLLNEEMMSFFDNHIFNLTISLDGGKDSNDKNRRFVSHPEQSVFDVVIEKIKLIRKKYKALYKKMALNMVLDPSTDFSDYENLLKENPFLKEITIMVAIKDDSYSTDKNVWIEGFKNKFNYKLFLCYFCSLYERAYMEDILYFSNALDTFAKDVYARQAVGSARDTIDIVYPLAMCLIGHDKVFVTVDGDLYPCERVNESNEDMKLGDIHHGFDIEKVEKNLNFYKFFEGRCKHCIAARECRMCLNNFGPTGIKDSKLTNRICAENRDKFMETIKRRAVFHEAKIVLGGVKNDL